MKYTHTHEDDLIDAIKRFGENGVLTTELPNGSVYALLERLMPKTPKPTIYSTVNRLKKRGVLQTLTVKSARGQKGAFRTIAIALADENYVRPVPAMTERKLTTPQAKTMIRNVIKELEATEMTDLAERLKAAFAVLEPKNTVRVKKLVTEAELAQFDERTQKILRLRGVTGETPHTLEETATFFDVTRERVRQIEARAMRTINDARTNEEGE